MFNHIKQNSADLFTAEDCKLLHAQACKESHIYTFSQSGEEVAWEVNPIQQVK